MQEKHKEKRSNVESINKFKRKIADKDGEMDEKEFEAIFNKDGT